MTQANVTIWELVGMSFRKVNPNIMVRSKIMAYQAGLSEKDGMTTGRSGKPTIWPEAMSPTSCGL